MFLFARFDGNLALSTAGGLQTTFLLTGAELEQHELLVHDTVFRKNDANYGGGTFFLVLGRNFFFLED